MTGGGQAAQEGPTSRLSTPAITGPAGALETLLQERTHGEPAFAAVVCHPHPLYGGTLHNKVVHRVAGTLHGLGAVVLRFNFRGAGKSEGAHDRGSGEVEDARAAVDWMRARHPDARLWLAGFSFGSWIAARLAAGPTLRAGTPPQVERLILIAPPIRTSSFATLHTCVTPKLVVQGTADDICPPELLDAEYPQWAEPKRLELVEGASHFFDRKLAELGEALERAIRELAWV